MLLDILGSTSAVTPCYQGNKSPQMGFLVSLTSRTNLLEFKRKNPGRQAWRREIKKKVKTKTTAKCHWG